MKDFRIDFNRFGNNHAGLEVAGVSEFVELYNVARNTEGAYYIDHVISTLRINNRLYQFYNPWEKEPVTFNLLVINGKGANWCKVNNREALDLPEPPQRVGKASAKKLLAWVEYLDKVEEIAKAYLQLGEKKKAELFARLEASGVDYKVNGNIVEVRNGYFCQKNRDYAR